MKSVATGEGKLYCIVLGRMHCDNRYLSNNDGMTDQEDHIPVAKYEWQRLPATAMNGFIILKVSNIILLLNLC